MIPLGQKLASQPQFAAPIDWGNPLTKGLVSAVRLDSLRNVVNNVALTATGTKRVATQKGIGRGFGSTYGAGTTDRVGTTLSGSSGKRSYFILAKANGWGGGNFGRLLDASAQEQFYVSSSNGLVYVRVFSSGQRSANTTAPASVSDTFGKVTSFSVSFDASDPANQPELYIGGTRFAFSSLDGTPSGSATTASNLIIGNRADNTRNFDGTIHLLLSFDRMLSAAEHAALSANPWQVFKAPQPTQFGTTSASPFVITSLGAAIQAPRTVATSLNAAIQAARTVSSSLSATVRQANAATASLSAQIVASGSMSVSAQLSAAIRQGNSANAALSAAVSQARLAVASITGTVQQPRSASALASAAIRQAKSAAANLNSAIQSAKTASASISAYVDTITRNTATASINAIIRQVASVSCSLSAIVDYESLPGGGSKKLRKKRVFIDGQEYFLNPIEAANLLINQAEQAQESAEEAPESPDEPECSSVVSAIDYAENKASRVMASDVFIARMNAEIQRMRALAIQRQLDEEDDIECLLLLMA